MRGCRHGSPASVDTPHRFVLTPKAWNSLTMRESLFLGTIDGWSSAGEVLERVRFADPIEYTTHPRCKELF